MYHVPVYPCRMPLYAVRSHSFVLVPLETEISFVKSVFVLLSQSASGREPTLSVLDEYSSTRFMRSLIDLMYHDLLMAGKPNRP